MAAKSYQMKDKVIIVTGAASGIGAAIVERFKKEGGQVVAVDRSPFLKPAARNVLPLCLDITEKVSVEAIMASTMERYNRIDVVINNAGIGDSNTGYSDLWEKFDNIITTNLKSAYMLSMLAMPALVKSGGNILNISSVFAMSGFRGTPGYSASKGGLSAMTRQMAADYSPKGVRVNAIAPGLIKTPLTQSYIENNPRFVASMIGCTALGRAGHPEDIANAASFLCSDEASFITGQIINVDGGWSDVRHFPKEINEEFLNT